MYVVDNPVTLYVITSDTVCQSPHVQLNNDRSQLTTCSSAAGHLLCSLVPSSATHAKRKRYLSSTGTCRLLVSG